MGGSRQKAALNSSIKTKKDFKQLRQRKKSEADSSLEQELELIDSSTSERQFGHRPKEVIDEKGLPYSQTGCVLH